MKHTFETKGFIWPAVIWCAFALFIQCLPIVSEYNRIQEIDWRYFGFPITLWVQQVSYDSFAFGYRGPSAIVVDVIFTVVFLAATLGGSLVIARRYKLWNRSRLIKSGRCGNCGYDLTATTSPTCPECGHVIAANE
jgi:hypothetical protein